MNPRTIAELRLRVAQLELRALDSEENRLHASAGTVSGRRANARYKTARQQLSDYRRLLEMAEKDE